MKDAAAEILVRRARIWSDGAPLAGADAVAIGGGRVLAVGPWARVAPLAGPRTVELDAGGGTLTPGLTDAHLHLVQWSRSLDEIALHDAASRDEVVERVRRAAAADPATGVLVGRGWDDHSWSEPPDRAALDRVCPDRPVLLHRRDFHALWVNGAALAAASVTRQTPDPEGGRIERDAAGEPTGVIREHAVRLFAGLERHDFAADLERVGRAVERLHAAGITAVHDFEGPEAERVLRAMTRGEGPRVRVLMHQAQSALDGLLAADIESGDGDDDFRIGAVKLFADGTLGSRTAAMLEPYDGTTESGMDLMDPAELRALVARALAGGVAVAIHAIGDRACRNALDAFAAARRSGRTIALPPRIEHAQLVADPDVERFAALGVAASMQPQHCVSDLEIAGRYWGTRSEHAYAWRRLHGAGALVAFGSDAPVEPPEPVAGLSAAVLRRRPGSPAGTALSPGQRLTLDEALSAYTEAPARLAGQWPRLGRIAEGACADLVLWREHLHALGDERLHEASVRATLRDGRIVYAAAGEPVESRGAR